MPRYDLPDSADGSSQWIELTDRAELTRKELHAIRTASDAYGGVMSKLEAQTTAILAHCLENWEIRTLTGEALQRPQKGNVKQAEQYSDKIPAGTWYAIEDAINGDDGEGGYSKDHLQPVEKDPQKPSTG